MTMTATAHRAGTTIKQKVALVLAGLYSLANVPSVLTAPSDGEVGPPMALLVLDTLLGVLGVVAVIVAWRGNRLALRLAAGATILITITALPALFVDVPMWLKGLVGVSVVGTVVVVAMMLPGDRRPAIED